MLNRKKDIDLRVEFGKLLDEFGIDILYIRSNQHIRCKCYDPLHQCGDPKCPICFGTGHVASIQKIRTVTRQPRAFRDIGLKGSKIGRVSVNDMVLYIEEDKHARVGDYILMVAWSNTGIPIEVTEMYEIIDKDIVRDNGGRTEFTANTVRSKPELIIEADRYIKSLSVETGRKIADGERYVWPITL